MKNRTKRLLVIIPLVIAILTMYGCNQGVEKDNMYKQISQEEAKSIMDERSDIVVLDVRTEAEYAEGHIPGAVCIPNETIDENVSNELTDLDQTILVYCRSGNRSKQAATKLADLGYTDIEEFGGITDWPYDIVK